jgi:hypothetical protein
MGLFAKLFTPATPAWKSENEAKAIKAVEKMTNKAQLALAALESLSWKVKYEAVKNENLKDQGVLAEIAKNADEDFIRLEAIKKLTDQNVLAEIAKNDNDSYVRIEAAEKLTELTLAQQVFAGLAKNNNDNTVRRKAVTNLTDQSILAYVAQNDNDHRIRMDAAEKLIDQTLAQKVFAAIAKYGNSSLVRERAIEKLTDQSILADIAQKNRDSDVRMKAAEKLTDNTIKQNVPVSIDIKDLATAQEVILIIDELDRIGKTYGFLTSKRSLTYEIGERLNKIGGMELMRKVSFMVARRFPPDSGTEQELDVAWNGIGNWKG